MVNPEDKGPIPEGIHGSEVCQGNACGFPPYSVCFGNEDQGSPSFFFQKTRQNRAEPSHTVILQQTPRFSHKNGVFWARMQGTNWSLHLVCPRR
jgi:hypothetical protein